MTLGVPANLRIGPYLPGVASAYSVPRTPVVTGVGALGGGTVNFTDPLGYTKPRYYDVALPDETSAPHKWWVNLATGSGHAGTQGDPFRWSDLVGKAGVADGTGSYIYVKGTGAFSDISLIGAAGAEVVIKPWDDSTDATHTGRTNWTAAKQHVIFDGGKNLRIHFVNSGSNQFDPSIFFDDITGIHHDIVFRRTDWEVTNAGEWMGFFGGVTNFYLINNEFHAENALTPDQHHIYPSCYDGGTIDGFYVLCNIFRDTAQEAIEFNIRTPGGALFAFVDNVVIDGNAFHNCGNAAGGFGAPRSAITLSIGGVNGSYGSNGRISNNLIWNTGENSIRTWDNPTSWLIVSNTCVDWGMANPANGYCPAAFTSYSPANDPRGTFKNNIMYAAGNTALGDKKKPFLAGFSNTGKDFNACETGQTCGTNAQANLSGASFVSVDENNANFLKLAAGSTPIDHGTTGTAAPSPDYWGTVRPQGSAPDIGAYEKP